MISEILNEIPRPAYAEFAEIAEVFANLGGVQVELLGKLLRRDCSYSGGGEFIQAAEVNAQAVGRQLGDLFFFHRVRASEV